MDHKVIIPLDGKSESESLELADKLQGLVWGFKVNDLLLECGLDIVSKLKKFGKVFADPKLHDIPNTVKNGITRLESAGADLITVHASGGRGMLRAAAEGATNSKVLAVTALTSLGEEDTSEIYGKNPADSVLALATLAAESGIHGSVCSPKEVKMLCDNSATAPLLKVIPGIRPSWYGTEDDQKRKMTPAQAIANGADLLVIGRPITGDSNPVQAAERVNEELAKS